MRKIKEWEKPLRGIPYVGNKAQIAFKILDYLPPSKRFVDLFGGGGSMSLHASYSNKYGKVVYNELDPNIYMLINELILKQKKIDYSAFTVIDRERFFNAKNKEDKSLADNIILTVWSFSNNRSGYLWGRRIAPLKSLVSQALMFGNTGTGYDVLFEKAEKYKTIKEKYKVFKKYRHEILSSERNYKELQQLEQLQQLERLEQLERPLIEKIKGSNADYSKVSLTTDDLVYCDPPYFKTAYNYNVQFDEEKFVDWYLNCKAKNIYISEYTQLPHTEVVAKLGSKHRFVATTNSNKRQELLLKVIK